jgi:hypothetical protein
MKLVGGKNWVRVLATSCWFAVFLRAQQHF